jgi:hypothetical protein
VNANSDSHADLYKALKGGSNNFGVVTGLDLRAIPQEGLWGGQAFYNISVLPSLLEKFSAFGLRKSYDEFAQLTLLYGRIGNASFVTTHQHYTKPQPPPSTVFDTFEDLQLNSTFRVDSLTNFTIELEAPRDGSVRKAFATSTYKNNLQMLQRFSERAEDITKELGSVTGLQFVVSLQPFGQFITGKAAATGGNLLGLETGGMDRVVVCLTVNWADEADDGMMNEAIRALISQGRSDAEELGASDEFLFQNYAAVWQDVYGGVGKENREAFKTVSRRYDPSQLFQKAVLGGFKL